MYLPLRSSLHLTILAFEADARLASEKTAKSSSDKTYPPISVLSFRQRIWSCASEWVGYSIIERIESFTFLVLEYQSLPSQSLPHYIELPSCDSLPISERMLSGNQTSSQWSLLSVEEKGTCCLQDLFASTLRHQEVKAKYSCHACLWIRSCCSSNGTPLLSFDKCQTWSKWFVRFLSKCELFLNIL